MKINPKYQLNVVSDNEKFLNASKELDTPLSVTADYGVENRGIYLKTIGIDINSSDFLFVDGMYTDTLDPFHESFKTLVEDFARYKFKNKEKDDYLSVFARNFGELSSMVYYESRFGKTTTKEGCLEFTIDRGFEKAISRIVPDKKERDKYIVSYVDNAFIAKRMIGSNTYTLSINYNNLSINKLCEYYFGENKSLEKIENSEIER